MMEQMHHGKIRGRFLQPFFRNLGEDKMFIVGLISSAN